MSSLRDLVFPGKLAHHHARSLDRYGCTDKARRLLIPGRWFVCHWLTNPAGERILRIVHSAKRRPLNRLKELGPGYQLMSFAEVINSGADMID